MLTQMKEMIKDLNQLGLNKRLATELMALLARCGRPNTRILPHFASCTTLSVNLRVCPNTLTLYRE